MSTQALNCPNCGGAVASDHTQCEFCNSRLKTVACSACLGLMFLGSKFCDHCGRRASSVEVFPDERVGDCPRCRRPLESLRIEAAAVRECMGCGGFWTSAETFESICADKEQQSAVLTFINTQSFDSRPTSAINYVPCPDCKQLMNRSNFARSSGVIIDLCKQHGVWFDAEELPKILDFIDKGGLARAREKQKIALEEERAKLRDEQRKLAMMNRRTQGGGDVGWTDPISTGGDVLSVLFDLW
jgi:Zn-finger nucleic acid-binding protein